MPKFTQEEIANSVYKVAPLVYRRKDWSFTDYPEDDFIQDAAMHMIRLNEEGYFDNNKSGVENLDGLTYKLLSGHFVLNAQKLRYKDGAISYISTDQDSEDFGISKSKEYNAEIADVTTQSPDKIEADKEKIALGKALFEEILDTFSVVPYTTRKHTYKGHEKTLGDIELSEYNIGLLLSMGYNLGEILAVYGFEGKERHSQTSYISHKVQDTMNKLREILSELKQEDKNAIEAYIMSI